MNGQPYRYIELLASIVDDDGGGGQRTYVIRALSVATLAELAADLTAAQARGEDIEPVLATWSFSMTKRRRVRTTDQRPNAGQRGYNYAHQLERKRWVPIVATGTVTCPGCGRLIRGWEPFDLGHSPDRTVTHPEHASCNRRTATYKAASKRRRVMVSTRVRPKALEFWNV